MSVSKLVKIVGGFLALAAMYFGVSPALAHEAWFLNAGEMSEISKAIPPKQFISAMHFAMIMVPMAIVVVCAIAFEPKWRAKEERLFSPSKFDVKEVSSIVLCFGLAIMLLIAAFGLLPMMGQLPGTTTLFVANGVLASSSNHTPIIFSIQLVLAVMLISGFQVRLAAVGVICLAVVGHFLFGISFLDFSPHFIAPALLILSFGRTHSLCWKGSCRCLLEPMAATLHPEKIYPIARIMVGAGFIYLAFRYKFLEPGLIMTILEHTPLLFIEELAGPLVLIMGLVEFVAGLLLIFGVLVRPIALFLLFAFTFFALLLSESVFYHTQLYALSIVFLLCGPGNASSATGAFNAKTSLLDTLSTMGKFKDHNVGARVPIAGLFGLIMFVVGYSVPQIHKTNMLSADVYKLADNMPAPKLGLDANLDVAGNWYVNLDVQNFQFEERSTQSNLEMPTGHVHIYLDSKKIATARQSKVMLGKLNPGKHVITADVRTADHKLIVTTLGSVSKRIEISVPGTAISHSSLGLMDTQSGVLSADICSSSKTREQTKKSIASQFELRGSHS